ncbi:phosphatidylinositol glycan anchor biosynthesis class U protein-like isoform X2 [Hibiscus syriacus]|uniref:phosphatidylinositol glycan anchor biosynthesis class U protein-like isoform X2 n=1 Tax=Hibiscus syriacus TaxID=106335 RepID=UPI00192321C2|nr:phosphatidylinositol glycan anchor biosynthesis class U protein-like isoform X2 [Hibiscus syriacus]
MEKLKKKIRSFSFWNWVIASIIFRLILIYFPNNLNLSSRPEVSTPLTSFRRLSEGYWLKQLSMSPYAGSMYHGSPLLLSLLGPLTVKRIEGQPNHLLYSLVSVIADVVSAMLIRATGQNLQVAYFGTLKSFDLVKQIEGSEVHSPGDVAALIYLCNPFTIVACMGLSTSPIENMAVILCLYGACSRLIPLAAFGWVIATHMSLYPAILIIPVIFLLGRGPDAPPRKLFLQMHQEKGVLNQSKLPPCFSWGPIIHFAFWALLWSVYVLVLCGISLKQFGGLWEMFKRYQSNAIRFSFLLYGARYIWIHPHCGRFVSKYWCLMVGDSALYSGLLGWFVNELSDMQFSLFLFCGYVGVSPLSPVMHNLWIWRGTGNANFYFATTMVYACLQIVLVVEGVSAMLNHDRKLRSLITGKPRDAKS